MTVVLQHLAADRSRDGHNGLLTGLSFGQLGNAGVSQIVKPNL